VCGYLVQFESLLSTRGAEATMLGDFDIAVRLLDGFRIRLIPSICGGTTTMGMPVRVTKIPGNGSSGTWRIDVHCPAIVLEAAPSELRGGDGGGGLIAVHAALFTQGINEQQTLANAVGATGIQDAINREHYARLAKYFEGYASWCGRTSLTAESDITALRKEFAAIEAAVRHGSSRTSKNVGLLPSVADFCRKLCAGRCTSCKSAKDRTAMSVTWEHSRLLAACAGLPESQVQSAMQVMRDAGVRRFILVKNTGDARYAFNPLQTRLLPAVFKPPRTSRANLLSQPPS
jgi:hypothetical protein